MSQIRLSEHIYRLKHSGYSGGQINSWAQIIKIMSNKLKLHPFGVQLLLCWMEDEMNITPETFQANKIRRYIRTRSKIMKQWYGKSPPLEMTHEEHVFTTKEGSHILPPPDPSSVLLPNEMWAGKGNGGRATKEQN